LFNDSKKNFANILHAAICDKTLNVKKTNTLQLKPNKFTTPTELQNLNWKYGMLQALQYTFSLQRLDKKFLHGAENFYRYFIRNLTTSGISCIFPFLMKKVTKINGH